MAVYEYLCPKCRNQFELMRPMGEAEKPARCPKCGSKAQKLISGFGSKTGDSILSADEPFREGEVDSPNRLTLSSDPAEDTKLLPASGHFGSRGSLRRRDMAQTSLLQQLEEVASKIRLLERAKGEAVTRMEALEREKGEAVARTQTLEREVGEMASLITLAGEKVEEILNIGASDEISQPPAVNAPATSTAPERLGEFSADTQKELKGRFPRVFDPTEYRAQ